MEIHAHGVADAPREDIAPSAVLVQPDDPADALFVVEVPTVRGRHVVGLAQRDVEHSVGPDVADTRGMV
jgi:hypothetical protein